MDFSAIQILRDINLEKFRLSKIKLLLHEIFMSTTQFCVKKQVYCHLKKNRENTHSEIKRIS